MVGGYNILGRRGDFERCKYWKVDKKNRDLSEFTHEKTPDGTFYAQEITSEEKKKLVIGSGFIFDENSTTIKTNDYVDLKEGDLIEFQEEIWFVKSCQEKKVNKNRQFMKKPMKFSYIQIKR